MIGFACGALWIVLVLVASRLSPQVDLLRFPLAWIGVLVALDGVARYRRGGSPLRTPADWIAAGAASIVCWDVFELVNLRLRNWWYVGVSPDPWAGGVFGAISFATVLPAMRLLSAQLAGAQPVDAPRRPWKAAAGAVMLLLALAFPRYAFPFAWIFLWPICATLAGVRVPWRAMALGLPLGLLWESLNWRCRDISGTFPSRWSAWRRSRCSIDCDRACAVHAEPLRSSSSSASTSGRISSPAGRRWCRFRGRFRAWQARDFASASATASCSPSTRS